MDYQEITNSRRLIENAKQERETLLRQIEQGKKTRELSREIIPRLLAKLENEQVGSLGYGGCQSRPLRAPFNAMRGRRRG